MSSDLAADARRQDRRAVSADFVRAVLKGHSSLGLALAAIIYLVCLTGAAAVFANELQRWENPAAPRLTSVSAETVQRAYAEAARRAGGAPEHVFISPPADDAPWLRIVTQEADGREARWLADGEGRLFAMGTPWTEFLTGLHIRLHLPRTWGGFIVGLTGVALLSSLISGLLAHPRIFRDAFHLRLGGSRRLQEADLHNRLGVWALPFHLTVSLTGALLGLSTLIVGALGLAVFQGDTAKVYDLFLPPHPREDARTAPLLDLPPMFAEVRRRAPAGRIEQVLLEHPAEEGGAALFQIDDGSTRISRSDQYGFDRAGRLYHQARSAEANLGQRMLGSLGKLHFGWFGGGPVKVAYGLLGLGLSYLAAGGVLIWLARRRDKGRPAPRLEAIWAGVIWSQPQALAASACASLIAPAPATLPLAVWLGVSLAVPAVASLPFGARFMRGGSRVAGLLLLTAAALHLALRRGPDPMGWIVDGVLATVGLALLLAPRASRAVRPDAAGSPRPAGG